MMFEIFEGAFSKDAALSVGNVGNLPQSDVAGWSALLDRFGGASFGQGIYRVICASDVAEWNQRVATAFPVFANRISCFGFDWLGRVFAVDPGRAEQGQAGVVMFEPGTGEALEIPCNIHSFHDHELVEFQDAALASGFHKLWLESGGNSPRYGECIGYRKPLFLGGADELENLETSDIDIYWHLMGQLILKAKDAPLGTRIRVGV